MRTDDFDYNLPEELIAQEPAAVRDECRLLVMDRASGEVEDRIFKDIIDYLQPGDLLVANETRVMPARLLGAKRGTGGAAEVFLLRECGGPEPRTNRVAFWEVLVRPGKRLKPGAGAVVDFTNAAGDVVLSAEIIDWARDGQRGERVARLSTTLPSLDEALHAVGHTPLPPYIRDYAGDEELYQTVYSRRESSAAAPTAGLHFTPELIERLRERGIGWIAFLYVVPELRGHHCGIQLVGTAAMRFRQLGRRAMRLTVAPENPALGFYEKAGFVRVGTEAGALGDLLVMEWTL